MMQVIGEICNIKTCTRVECQMRGACERAMTRRTSEDLLRTIILRAIEAEGIPLPEMWKHNLTELCLRVITKLIGVEAALATHHQGQADGAPGQGEGL